jgi:hypothetical protein
MEKKDLNEVKYIRYHDSLSENLIERLKGLYPVINEIFPWSLDEWIDGFRYDVSPEKEIEIWEELSRRFQFRCKMKGTKTKEEKKKIFRDIWNESGAGRVEISKGVPSA